MLRHGRGESGTTIVEIAVGLAVGAVLVAGILLLVEQAQKSYLHSSEVTDLQQNVRVGMDRMVRIIQAAGVNPLNRPWGGPTPPNEAFTAFREAGRNCIRVYADLDGDGTVQQPDENVFFMWSTTVGEHLTEQQGTAAGEPDAGQAWIAASTGAQELARDPMGNPGGTALFRYFTGQNDPGGFPGTELVPPGPSTTSCVTLNAADRARIARVVITLTGSAKVGNETIMTKTLTADARARNVP